jgi:hypothetical protein
MFIYLFLCTFIYLLSYGFRTAFKHVLYYSTQLRLPSFKRPHIQCEYFKFFYITLKVKTNENQGGVGSVATKPLVSDPGDKGLPIGPTIKLLLVGCMAKFDNKRQQFPTWLANLQK